MPLFYGLDRSIPRRYRERLTARFVDLINLNVISSVHLAKRVLGGMPP